jgi:hypothetical protein
MLPDDTFTMANYLYLGVGSKTPGSKDLLARNGIAAGAMPFTRIGDGDGAPAASRWPSPGRCFLPG